MFPQQDMGAGSEPCVAARRGSPCPESGHSRRFRISMARPLTLQELAVKADITDRQVQCPEPTSLNVRAYRSTIHAGRDGFPRNASNSSSSGVAIVSFQRL